MMSEGKTMEMDLGPLFGLWFQSLFIGITMWALYICIFIVIYGRMIEIYLVTSVAPVPMAASDVRKNRGKNCAAGKDKEKTVPCR